MRTLSDGRALFLDAPAPALFRLDVDPGEADDLAAREPALLALWSGRRLRRAGSGLGGRGDDGCAIRRRARRRADATAGEPRLSRRRSRRRAVSVDLPDPRRHPRRHRPPPARGGRRGAGGALRGTLRELQSIVERDPHNFPALSLAGQCLRDAGRDREALALFDRAAAENQLRRCRWRTAQAASCVWAGRRRRSASSATPWYSIPPRGDSAANLARLRRRRASGRSARAARRGPRRGRVDPVLYLERGTVRAAGGNLVAALADFREASRRAPEDPVALENAGAPPLPARPARRRRGELRSARPPRARAGRRLEDARRPLYLELGDAAGVERAAREAAPTGAGSR
ncbi:MAG: hypothetical protein R2862_12740 [Thermoanaerobaculia bacterium]